MLENTGLDKPSEEFVKNVMLALLNYICEDGLDAAIEKVADVPEDELKVFPHLYGAIKDKKSGSPELLEATTFEDMKAFQKVYLIGLGQTVDTISHNNLKVAYLSMKYLYDKEQKEKCALLVQNKVFKDMIKRWQSQKSDNNTE